MKILVTGAGGPAGVCVIKSLRSSHSVVAVDVDKLASGLYLAEKSYLVPSAGSKNMIKKVLDLAREEKVSVVIPTVNEEMIHFAESREKFSNEGMEVVVSNPESIRTATDKAATYRFFEKEEYCPKIYDEEDVEYPCVVKPTNSRGSRGFFICNSEEELEVAVNRNTKDFKSYVIMEYMEGTEYSVYGISDMEGKPIFAAASKRIEADGESKKAQIVEEKSVAKVAEDVASKLKIVGPWNVQIMKTPSGVKLIEVNPRFAGTLSLVNATGVNYVELAIKVFTGKKIGPRDLDYKTGIIMTRYNEEIFVDPDRVVTSRG